jgi:hypothetical protein
MHAPRNKERMQKTDPLETPKSFSEKARSTPGVNCEFTRELLQNARETPEADHFASVNLYPPWFLSWRCAVCCGT